MFGSGRFFFAGAFLVEAFFLEGAFFLVAVFFVAILTPTVLGSDQDGKRRTVTLLPYTVVGLSGVPAT